MNWYYIDGPRRVGPLNETEWAELLRTGVIQPETLVWHEGMEKWTPYKLVSPPEEPGAGTTDSVEHIPEEPEETPEAFAARVVDLDYPVNLGRCVSRAWEVWISDLLPMVGAASIFTVFNLIVGKAAGALNFLEVLPLVVVQGILAGGLYDYYLHRMRGVPASITVMFSGFQTRFLTPLALQAIVSYLVSLLCFWPMKIAIKMLGIDALRADPTALAARFESDPNAVLVFLLVFLACSIPAVYFAFCWMFSIPLIIDKHMAFWPAMQLSRRKVLQHPWRVGVVSVVAGFLGIVGIIGFLIGAFFTAPLYFLVLLYLYEDMFNVPPRKPDGSQTH